MKMECIYRDKEHENKITNELKDAKAAAQAAQKEFETLTGKKVDPDNFQNILKNAVAMVNKDFEEKAEIPDGYEKTEYLKLLKYPDAGRLRTLLANLQHTELLGLSDNGEVVITGDAETLITKKNLYLNEAQHVVYQKIIQFVELHNQLSGKLPSWSWLLKPTQFLSRTDGGMNVDTKKLYDYIIANIN